MQRRSAGVNRCSSAVKKPLLRMLRWVSVAPFGKPVVPDVYWMLIGSSGPQLRPPLVQRGRRDAGRVRHSSSHSGDQRKIARSSAGRSARTSSTIAT